MKSLVETKYGKVNGVKEDGVIKWLGVPYAKPPVGKLSFKRAQPCEAWEGIKECKQFGNKPIQFGPIVTKIPESKDCLYLNIWRKDSTDQKLPVMVWIYGGGFKFGEGSYPTYDGTNFAKDNVLCITINYRLGIYGIYDFSFYNHELFDSNCTLSDQIMALKWIKENIECFGGDSNNITIAGESAGAFSVGALLAAPSAKELFHKAIIQSGCPGFINSKKSAKLFTDLFMKHAGITADTIDKLIDMDKMSAVKALNDSQKELFRDYPAINFPGFERDDLLPEDAVTALSKGVGADKKILIGTNKDESALFYKRKSLMPVSWQEIEKGIRMNHCEAQLEVMQNLYKHTKKESQWGKNKKESQEVKNWNTDRYFLVSSIQLAKVQSQFNDVWMYRFDCEAALMKLLGLGAMHASEISFVFNNNDVKSLDKRLWTGTSKKLRSKLSHEMHKAWVQFIKFGNPNDASNEPWVKYDSEKDNIMVFDKKSRMENRDYKEILNFWERISLYSE